MNTEFRENSKTYINTDISLHNKDMTKPSHNIALIQVEISGWQEKFLKKTKLTNCTYHGRLTVDVFFCRVWLTVYIMMSQAFI